MSETKSQATRVKFVLSQPQDILWVEALMNAADVSSALSLDPTRHPKNKIQFQCTFPTIADYNTFLQEVRPILNSHGASIIEGDYPHALDH